MSGYKRATVTISEQEYRRLHDADMKRRFGERKKAKARESGTSPELILALEQMEQRQQQLEQALRELGENSNQAGEEDLQAILVQNAFYYEQLSAMIESTTATSHEGFAQLSEDFTERMQQQYDDYCRSLQTLTGHLDFNAQKEQDKGELAREWLERSILLGNLIQEQFDQERFAPGRLAAILMGLELAENNLVQGLAEACLQSSQQAFLQLTELHFELEQRTLEWQAEYERAFRTIREVITNLEVNSTVGALGLQGEELAEEVDADYWTGGKHGQLLAKCRQIQEVLLQDREHIPTEDLKRTYMDWLPEITGRLESIIYEARMNALNSQLRMNIAEQALQALETQGFLLHESGYIDGDMRSSFVAYLDNPDGSQVTIQVLPSEPATQDLANELVVTTRHSEVKTEREVYLQWQELRRSLNEGNLEVSQPEVRHRPPVRVPDQVQQPPILDRPVIRSER